MTTKFTNLKDSQGKLRTNSLFVELVDSDLEPVFTLKDRDYNKNGKTYPSLKKLYMAYDHIPGFEYEFALDTFGSWDHWQRLVSASIQIQEAIKSWRDELDVRIKAKNLKAVIRHAEDDDPKGLQAAKYLIEKGYAPKRGRPSKEEVEREIKANEKVKQQFKDDLERIGLRAVN